MEWLRWPRLLVAVLLVAGCTCHVGTPGSKARYEYLWLPDGASYKVFGYSARAGPGPAKTLGIEYLDEGKDLEALRAHLQYFAELRGMNTVALAGRKVSAMGGATSVKTVSFKRGADGRWTESGWVANLPVLGTSVFSGMQDWVPDPGARDAAKDAAAKFVARLDAGAYDDAYRETDPAFRAAVTPQRWAELTAKLQTEPRPVQWAWVSTREMQRFPGQPDGQYAEVDWVGTGANGLRYGEAVFLHRAADGAWRLVRFDMFQEPPAASGGGVAAIPEQVGRESDAGTPSGEVHH